MGMIETKSPPPPPPGLEVPHLLHSSLWLLAHLSHSGLLSLVTGRGATQCRMGMASQVFPLQKEEKFKPGGHKMFWHSFKTCV